MLANFLELNFKGLHQSSGKESCCLLFPSWTKRELRQFRVVVVQRRQRKVQKSVMHEQSCCFACLNLQLFCRSRCRRRCRCVNSLMYSVVVNTTVVVATYLIRTYLSGYLPSASRSLFYLVFLPPAEYSTGEDELIKLACSLYMGLHSSNGRAPQR